MSQADQRPPLRMFLAMPGTDLGPDAVWKDPKDVRRFYDKVAKALAERLDRPVDLGLEREKRSAGVIHDSMFLEALNAEVYLADLTGENPNVFLELGVRYALRPHVTIPLSQSTERLPFNVEHMRAVQYANRPDDVAIEKIVDLIDEGLRSQHNDSPVLSVLDVVTVDRALWEKISGARADTLLRAADRAEDTSGRLQLLREALESAPRSIGVRLQLAVELRKAASFTEAMQIVQEGIRLDPSQAAFHHELGLNLGKVGGHENGLAAVSALRDAVRLEPESKDYLASLGGALRRLAMRRTPDQIDETMLREALASYQAAVELDRYDTYPALNLARMLLLCSKFDAEAKPRALGLLQRLQHLCAFEVAQGPKEYWRLFDLADVRLLLCESETGCQMYRTAIELIPPAQRRSILRSPLSALTELRDASVLDTDVKQGVADAIRLLEEAMDNE